MLTPTTIQIAIAIAVILISVLLLRNKSTTKPRILLVGPTSSGKTSIGLRMLNKSSESSTPPPTRTSSTLNTLNLTKCLLIDIPGHERICFDYLKEQLRQPYSRILYCIDYKQVHGSVSHFNTFLHTLSEHKKQAQAHAQPYSVVLTKFDKPDTAQAITIQRARNALEFELNKMRKSSSATANTNNTISLSQIPFLTCNLNSLDSLDI